MNSQDKPKINNFTTHFKNSNIISANVTFSNPISTSNETKSKNLASPKSAVNGRPPLNSPKSQSSKNQIIPLPQSHQQVKVESNTFHPILKNGFMRPQIINNNLNSNNSHIYKTEQQKETNELYYIKKNNSTTSTASIGSSSSIITSSLPTNQSQQRTSATPTPAKVSPVNSANISKASQLQNSQLDSLLDSKKAREAFFERLRNTETQNINKNARLSSTPTKENSKLNTIDLEKPPTVNQHINKMLAISMNNNNINTKPPIANSNKTDEENSNNPKGNRPSTANVAGTAVIDTNGTFNTGPKPFDAKNNFSNVVKIDMRFKSESVEKIETSDGQKNLGFLSSNLDNNEDYNKHKLNLNNVVSSSNNNSNQESTNKVNSEQQQVSLQARKNSQELERAFVRDNLKNLFIRRNSLNGSDVKKKVPENQVELNESQISKTNELNLSENVRLKGNDLKI